MSNKKYDTLVYIGRFQPIHNAHIETIRRATILAKQVIVIIGSANLPRTYKNPFSSRERELMLRSSLEHVGDSQSSIRIMHNRDTIYNDQAWAVRVQELVSQHTYNQGKIGIIGHDKDESTFYLKMFPQWGREEMELIEPLDATSIRDLYFKPNANLNFIRSVVPAPAYVFLDNWTRTPDYAQIIREREFVEMYKKQYSNLPYPPIFVTTDAVVIQAGNVLMIKRRSEPGRGLWALPGGFVNASTDKSMEDAMIRELYEETGIKLPEKVVRGSIEDRQVFDAIGRSSRGRTITHAFKIVLADGEWNLPKVKGADDAEKAEWIPIGELNSEQCFEDHYEIIQHFLGA